MVNIHKYVEMSDLDEDFNPQYLTKNDVTDAYRQIYEYHSNKDDTIRPQKCIIKDPNGEISEIPTIAGTYFAQPSNIDNYNSIDQEVSNYDIDLMNERLAIDTDSIWNGSTAGIKYDKGGTVNYFKTDFFTRISFSRILLLEAVKNAKNNRISMSFRDYYTDESEYYWDTENICTGASSGAIIIGENYASDTVILVGKRSDNPYINKNRYSIVPNSNVKYEHLVEKGFEETVEEGIVDELIYYARGIDKLAESVEVREPYIGWNLRDCSLLAVYYLLVKDSSLYESVKDSMRENEEFNKIVEVPIKDYQSISSLFSMRRASPENIPAIARAVRIAMRDDDMDDIEYEINTNIVN